MRVRAAAASLAIHAAIVVAVIASAVAVKQTALVDIEIVPAITTEVVAPPPPPPVGSRSPGGSPGEPRADPVPPPPAPVKRPRPVHASAPPPSPAPSPDEPAAPASVEVEAAAGAPSAASTTGDGDGGGGSGHGTGGGVGDGAGELDLSARPVPINADQMTTLPYTEAAARDRVSGYVYLVLTVDPLGHVGRATVRRGLGHGLDEIATRLALQIQFRPARDRHGQPIEATVTWRFYFEPP